MIEGEEQRAGYQEHLQSENSQEHATTLPLVFPTSTQDAAVNTDPITIGEMRPATDVASSTPISMVIGLPEEKAPSRSPVYPVPRPPSQRRPPNMPRRNSPLASSLILPSSAVRDGTTSKAVDETVKRSITGLDKEERRHSYSSQ